MKIYKLENLDCADCAVKIEQGLKKLSIIDYVSVDFATSRMRIKTDNISQVISTIHNIDPNIKVFDEGKNVNYRKDRRNIKYELILMGFLFGLFITGVFFEQILHSLFYGIPEYILFLGIYLISGWKVLLSAGRNILKGRIFDENFLMTLATTGAILIHALPEAAGVMLFFKIGTFFEELSVNKSRKSIESLLAIRPDYANLKTETGYIKISPEKVNVDDIILVKPGERVPLDGVIISGESLVDTSAMTGESVPKNMRSRDTILSGMIPVSGSLIIKVRKVFSDSSVARILDLVQNAVQKKAKTEKFITTFSRVYTPTIVVLAVLVAIIPPFFFKSEPLGNGFTKPLSSW